MPYNKQYPGEGGAQFRNRQRRQANQRPGAVRPRRPGAGQRNRQGEMKQLMQDALIGRQIRMSRMQRNQARGRRNPGGVARPPQRRK